MSEQRECRMFPLGSVLVPGSPLPLHIFEQRYQRLLNDALEDDQTFAVVLISRGSEVGGGDVRTDIGTLARIDECSRLDDGRAALLARGVSRIEVVDWLPDDPYPRALVRERLTSPPQADDKHRLIEAQSALADLVERAHRLRRIDQVAPPDWADDVETAGWQLAARAPISVLDRQRVLATDALADRLALLRDMLHAIADDLRMMNELDE